MVRKKIPEKSKSREVDRTSSTPGVKPLYDNEKHPELVYKLALLGATDKQMAEVMGIALSTFDLWKTKHPDFFQQLKQGKMIADTEVAVSLFQRAKGYEYLETKVKPLLTKQGELVTAIEKTTKHIPANVTAAIFWLKNRQRQMWADVKKLEIGTGKEQLDLSMFTEQEQLMMRQIGLKQLTKIHDTQKN